TQEGEAVAVDGSPDFFLARPVGMRFAQRERINGHSNDALLGRQSIRRREKFCHDMSPVSGGAAHNKRVSASRSSLVRASFIFYTHFGFRMKLRRSGLIDDIHG